jgi:hypothetical protein
MEEDDRHPRNFIRKTALSPQQAAEELKKLAARYEGKIRRNKSRIGGMEFTSFLILWYMRDIEDETERRNAFRALSDLYFSASAYEDDARISDPMYRRFILTEQTRLARRMRSQGEEETTLVACINAELGTLRRALSDSLDTAPTVSGRALDWSCK